MKHPKKQVNKTTLLKGARHRKTEKKFREIRRRLVPYARAKGLLTDDDIEKFLG